MMFMTQFNAVADRLVKSLSLVANGKTVFSMHEYFCHVTIDVIAEVFLARHFVSSVYVASLEGCVQCFPNVIHACDTVCSM